MINIHRSFISVVGVSLALIILASGFFLRGASGANDNDQITQITPAATNLLGAKLEQTYALADFNSDGLTDVAVTDFISDAVLVMAGDRAGYFHSVARLSSGGGPRAMVAADFNRDGAIDLAVAGFFSGDVAIFLGRGDGGFQPARPVKLNVVLISIIAEDFDSDGLLDLAAAIFLSGEIVFLKGSGDGSFETQVVIGQVQSPTLILSRDFDRDGLQDLVAFGASEKEARLFTGKGDGAFKDAGNVDVATAISSERGQGLASDARLSGESRLLRKLFGEGQSAPANTALPQPLVIEVGEQGESSRAGRQVTFSMLHGDGKLEANDTRTTDERGQASRALFLGELPGNNLVAAAAEGQVAVFGESATLSYEDFFGRIRAALVQLPLEQISLHQQIALLDQAEQELNDGNWLEVVEALKESVELLAGASPSQSTESKSVIESVGLAKRLINQVLLFVPESFVLFPTHSAKADVEGRPCDPEPTNMLIGYGDLITCGIDPSGDIDVYRFQGSATEVVSIQLTYQSGSGRPCLELFDPAGVSLGSHCPNAFSARIDKRLERAGIFTIRVSAWNNGTMNYSLSLERIAPPSASARLLRFNQNLADEINPTGDIDLYFFTGAINDLVTIQLTHQSGSGRPCLELFDPAGVPLGSHCPNAFSARIDKRLESTGTYTIRVSAWNNGTMSYSVDLQCVGQCPQPQCPTVSGISPMSGAVGASVTITGANFIGVTSVRFFSTNITANFTVHSNTQITATVPNGAANGPITISKPNCPDVPSQSFTVITGPCIPVSLPGELSGLANGSLMVPVTVPDLTGRSIVSYDFTITFDPSVLRPSNPPVDKTSTLSSAMTITTNTATPGRLTVSGFGTAPLSGAGTLLNLKFDLIGSSSACSNLTWASFRFNEGTPCATTTNGRVCVADSGSIAGTISYCISPKAVPGVIVTAAGTPPKTSTTNSAGNYQLMELGSGSYTVTPTKTGDGAGNSSISSFDASLVAQHVAGLITLTACQQLAGDASNNGSLSSFDASLIAQTAAGIANSGIAGTWRFMPPNRSYPSVTGNLTNQNFDAVLVGDVSGNWSPSASSLVPVAELQANLANEVAQVAISLPTTSGTSGSSLTIPITVSNLTGRGYVAYDFDITFNNDVLRLQEPPYDAAGTLSSGMNITPNATTGRLRVSAFGTAALAAAGTLLNLKFNVVGAPGTSTDLTWQRFLFNEEAQTNLVNGRFTVSSPSGPPAVTTSAASSVTNTSATLNGSVNPNGLATNIWFEWGTSSTLASFNTTPMQAVGSGTTSVAVSANLSGLTAGTTYYFRLAGANSAGTARGAILSFTTLGTTPNPVPKITNLNPNSAIAGGAGFTLTVNGQDFVSGAVVMWNNSPRPTRFVSSVQLTADIAVADIATAGAASVTAFNPGPGGGPSNALSFTINPRTTPAEALAAAATMSPANEIPPITGLNASGGFVVKLVVNRGANGAIIGGAVNFLGTVSFPGSVTITGLHIHEAGVTTNGGIVIESGISDANPLTLATGSGLINVTNTNASAAVLSRILKNPTGFYVNLHTSVNPNGAMRGQIVRLVETQAVTVQMSPANEVPPITGLAATGAGTITVNPTRNPDTGEITGGVVIFSVLAQDFPANTTVTGLHIHEASAGVNGGIVFDTRISSSNPVQLPTGRASIRIEVPLTTGVAIAALQRLVANPAVFYVNLHTSMNPGGAIRAQLSELAEPPIIWRSNTYFLETGGADATIGLLVTGIDPAGTAHLNGQMVPATLDVNTGELAVTIPAALRANAGTLFVQARNGQRLMSAPLTIVAAAASSVNSVPIATTDAAKFGNLAAPEAIAVGFGTRLASATAVATTLPLPTTLDGTSVYINGVAARLFFVSRGQINYLVPAGTIVGPAEVVVLARDGTVSRGALNVAQTTPGIFTSNSAGTGAPAAVASANGQVFNILMGNPDGTPREVGAGNFVVLFGTGLRYASTAAMTMTIGTTNVTPLFFGAQPDFAGLDQVNLQIPASMAGAGNVNLTFTLDGKTSNPVQLRIR